MNMLSAERLPWLALLLSGGLLCGAWFFQYVLDYAPCQMCYWQRDAHKGVMVVALIAILCNHFKRGKPGFWASLVGVALLVSFGMGFWHMGVEYKWWEGPKTCLAAPLDMGAFSTENLLESLSKPVKLPACSDAVWHFLGLSMAAWNALISLCGAAVSFIAAGRSAHV